MPRRPKHADVVRAAKDEALLAVDLFNRIQAPRTLEGFIVHMSIAWLYLFHAVCQRDEIDCGYKDRNGNPTFNEDGTLKLWELGKCVEHLIIDAEDPVRKNIEFFIGLRNTIVHRFKPKEFEALRVTIEGKAHAFVRNFEERLVSEFGKNESLGNKLRFPIFLSTFSDDALESVKRAYARLGAPVRRYIENFRAALADDIASNSAFDFRVRLVPKTTSAPAADLALEFIRLENLSEAERQQLEGRFVAIRDRQVEVTIKDKIKPGQVVFEVRKLLPWFNQYHHQMAARHFNVHPQYGSAKPEDTEAKYCVYVEPFKAYVYTKAWVQKLLREFQTSIAYEKIIGKPPKDGYYAKPAA
jgi:hypothetical protein